MRFWSLLALLIVLASLAGCVSNESETTPPSLSKFLGHFDTPSTRVPFRFILSDTSFSVINGDEIIALEYLEHRKDTQVFRFPQYDSYLSVVRTDSIWGWWQPSASSGKPILHFTAQPYSFNIDRALLKDSLVEYQCAFYRNDSSLAFDAVARMRFYPDGITGTFLTETGDFRFLQGEKTSHELWLSTFDGDHLYYAVAQTDDSNISGLFYSGINPPYYWSGQYTNMPIISNPDSLTYVANGAPGEFTFEVMNFDGDSIYFDSNNYQNKVTVVSIFGSWCPNCHDELKMYAELLQEINHPNLNVVPVAFERGDDLNSAKLAVNRVKQYTGFTDICYYGGKSSKQTAAAVFPQLNNIVAFPTSVFIDKFGNVRKIHTGFNGPGTGEQYTNYKADITRFLEALLNE